MYIGDVKNCYKCDITLVKGENISNYKWGRSDYICKSCLARKQRQTYHQKRKHAPIPSTIDKKCRVCDGELVVGENISETQVKNYSWICKPCYRKEYGIQGDIVGRPKKYHSEEERKQANKQANYRRWSQIPSGIYCFKDKKGKIVYIGESKYPLKRREGHLWNRRSILKEELQDCEWDMMEEISDEHLRKIREFELIYEHKPKYNYPYRI